MRILLLLIPLLVHAQGVDPSTLKGKVLLGYQGWFRCPAGGTSGTNWSHWTSSGAPTAASISIDMYPDTREFEPGEACAVPGMTVGSAPAYLFSAGNSKTVARHFRWMQQYGLDGVLVQRFVSDIPGDYAAGDAVLKNIMAAALQSGRVFAIEYDISGANPTTMLGILQQDWNYLVNTLKVTDSPRYLRENGKPVVSVWGIGLNDSSHPPNDIPSALQLIDWFRTTAQVTYIGGTPAYWRTNSNDAWSDPNWSTVYRTMDVVQPWTVGRYATLNDVDNWMNNRIAPDLAATANNGQLYMPVIFPGFSWYNLRRTAAQNQIPRNGGSFLWRQAYNARRAGAQMLKIAMFDEVNEATANFKIASRRQDAPDQGYWLTLDADGFTLPSDWYLRLAGEITRVFDGQSAPAAAVPASPGPPWGDSNVTAVSAANFKPQLAAESLASAWVAAGNGTSIDVIDSTGFARSAPISFASPTQVNFQIPAGTATGSASIVVIAADGTTSFGGMTISAVAPGLFTADSSGSGPAAAIFVDGVLELFGTGIRGRSSIDNVACTIGGVQAQVLYAGAQLQYDGLDQVNVLLPPSLSGTVTVKLTVDGQSANTVTVAIR